VAYAGLALAALVPIWSVKYLPMVDLPQHAAQITLWMHLDDPAWGLAGEFQLNPYSPYLLGYALARIVGTFTSALVAVKVVVTLAILALPVSMQVLLDRWRGDRFWALLGFPLAFGVAFYWGLFNYLVAVPAAVLYVALAARYAELPTLRRAVVLGLAGCGLYVAHALILGICSVVAFALIALRAGGLRNLVVRALPLGLPLALAAAWARWTYTTDPYVRQAVWWNLGLHRVWYFPWVMLGADNFNTAELVAFLLMAATLLLAASRGGAAARWLPATICVAGYLLAPSSVFGTALIHGRIAELAAVFTVVAVAPLAARSPSRRTQVARTAIVALVLGWTVLLTVRFRAFDEDAVGLDTVIAAIPPGQKVLGLMFAQDSRSVPGYPFLHAGAWYQAEKGGVFGFSAASFFPALIRYGPNASGPVATEEFALDPSKFDWSRDGWYDWFIVRAPVDAGPFLVRTATVPISLRVHDGSWWLYAAERGVRSP
jgi:hypothetical protein